MQITMSTNRFIFNIFFSVSYVKSRWLYLRGTFFDELKQQEETNIPSTYVHFNALMFLNPDQ